MSDKPAYLLIILGLVLLGASTLLASMEAISEVEKSLFYLFYDLPDSLKSLARIVTVLGTVGITVLTIGLSLWEKRYKQAGVVIPSIIGAYALAYVIKNLVARGRPAELLGITPRYQLDVTAQHGFPSGYVTIATVVTVLLVFQLQGNWRLFLWLIPLAVGASRLYLGEHLPLDIVGGIGIGLVVGSLPKVR